MDSGLTTSDYGWGTANFRKLGLHKVQLVLDLAKTGVNCLTVDADAFLLRDPFPYIRALPTADVLTSSDHLVASKGYADTGLEDESGFHSAFNIGCAAPRSSGAIPARQFGAIFAQFSESPSRRLYPQVHVLPQVGAAARRGVAPRDQDGPDAAVGPG